MINVIRMGVGACESAAQRQSTHRTQAPHNAQSGVGDAPPESEMSSILLNSKPRLLHKRPPPCTWYVPSLGFRVRGIVTTVNCTPKITGAEARGRGRAP